jgi:hypothetical protein
MKELCGAARLVSLQVADQVPDGFATIQFPLLGLKLLDAVFAEMPHSQFVSSANCLCRERFGHRYQRDFIHPAAATCRCLRDALANLRQIFSHSCEIVHLVPEAYA